MQRAFQVMKRIRGTSIVEAAAGIMVGLPLVVAIIFVGLEVSMYFMIQSNLDAATRKATRALAHQWGRDPSVATDTSRQRAIFTDCLINGYVNDPAQFSNPLFNGQDPPSVTVVGTYTSGQYGLASYPPPNPLNLGNNFIIRSEATYRLE